MLQLVNTEQLTLNGPLAFMTQKPRATETQNIGSVFPNHYLVAHNTHIIQASFTLLSRRNQYDDDILLGAWQMISVTYMSNYSCKYHSVILLQPTTDMHQIKSYFLSTVMHWECSTMRRRTGFRKCLFGFMHVWN